MSEPEPIANSLRVLLAWMLAGCVTIAGCGGGDEALPEATPTPDAMSEPIPMSFMLIGEEGDDYTYDALSGCKGDGGYGDIREGMLINMTDSRGNIIGLAELDGSENMSPLGCRIEGTFDVSFDDLDPDITYLIGDRAGKRGEIAQSGQEIIDFEGIALSLG